MRIYLSIFTGLLFILSSAYSWGGYDVDFYGNLDTSVRTGRLASVTSKRGQYGVNVEFSPSFNLVRTSPRARTSILYGLRAGSDWRSTGTESFLLFHQLTATQQYTISRRLVWNARGNLNYGEMDYSRSLFLFGSNIGDENAPSPANGRPQSQVIRYFGYSANSGMSLVLSNKTRLSVSGAYSANDQITDNSPRSAVFSEARDPSSKTASLSSTLSTRISGTSTLSASITGSMSVFSKDLQSLPVTALLGATYRARENLSFSAQVGTVVLVETYDETAINDGTARGRYYWSWLPAGRLSLNVRPKWNTITMWSFSTFVTVDTYVDTSRAAVLPRSSAGFSAVSIITPKIRFQSSLSATSPLRNEARGEPLANNTFPAAAAASAQFSFELRRATFLRVGGQASTSLSYLFDYPIKTGSREMAGMVSFVMLFDPNHSGANE